MLTAICNTFLTELAPLDQTLPTYAVHLEEFVWELARDAAAETTDYGEAAALISLCEQVLGWIASEQQYPADLHRRSARQRAVEDLVTFCAALS